MYLLMLITAIIIAGLMGVRFDGSIGIIYDYRGWVAAIISTVLWTFIGALFSAFGKKDEKESNEGGEDKND